MLSKFIKLKDSSSRLHNRGKCTEQEKEQLSELLKNDYIARKCDRSRRIKDQLDYIEKYGKELLNNKETDKLVVDIGPGPGEFLEVCRFLGYKSKGFDARLDDCEMGKEYVLFSSLMSRQQELDIEYIGFENILSSLPFEDSSTYFVNSRGSIEQVFKDFLLGVPHRVHKKASYLCWSITDDLKNTFVAFLKEIERILEPGGVFLIFGNGAMNTPDYDSLIRESLAKTPNLYLESGLSFEHRLHKIKKRVL